MEGKWKGKWGTIDFFHVFVLSMSLGDMGTCFWVIFGDVFSF